MRTGDAALDVMERALSCCASDRTSAWALSPPPVWVLAPLCAPSPPVEWEAETASFFWGPAASSLPLWQAVRENAAAAATATKVAERTVRRIRRAVA